jgi:16S rRNA (guanine(966)-N(2))-methyltransferase RsmD
MRIVAGRFKGRRLHAPKSRSVRPTTDRVREALFSILADRVEGARVLDLFAGTGAVGLEALSRGAASAVFVERDAGAVRLIRENVRTCGAEPEAEILAESAPRAVRKLAARGARFDLIFMDPPYRAGVPAGLPEGLSALAGPLTLLVIERSAGGEPCEVFRGWQKSSERRYGDTILLFLERESSL